MRTGAAVGRVAPMKAHADKDQLDKLFPAVREYQKLAAKHGIKDIFQDNGGKLLQVVLTLGLTVLPGREGNDAKDENGKEYELKSVNIDLQRQVTTHHHLNPTIIAKYRLVDWVFAVYSNIELIAIYLCTPKDLEPLFTKWEQRWHETGGKDINNPKIPLEFIVKNGKLVHGSTPPPKAVKQQVVLGEEDMVEVPPANGNGG